ncbi:MAG: acyl-CoA dehydrogenase family protein, partial [Bdellovibrionia bacterium]
VPLERNRFSKKGLYEEVSKNLLLDVLSFGRLGVAVMALGAMNGVRRLAIEACENHGFTKQQWGQHELARMQERLETSRAAVWFAAYEASIAGIHSNLYRKSFRYADKMGLLRIALAKLESSQASLAEKRAASLGDEARRAYSARASALKASVTDAALRNIFSALELTGIDGAHAGSELAKIFRDAKLLQIYEGPNLVNRLNLYNFAVGYGRPGYAPFVDVSREGGVRGHSV